ncbi:ShlB/FhaC/HecB family hemolysin secretion/activation protein [Gallibacterium melopsittaci]|uniref:ShlB/FhaC/HecB family hemolysin secretion/activation protein n=1 Tax=Gallibacterium melopsittaci TaxID=516063 RepID=A0ABV6HW69_9PAST
MLGKLDGVVVANQSRLKDEVIAKYVSALPQGEYLQQESAERLLRRLNRLSGITTQAGLQAGQTVGGTALQLLLADTQRIDTLVYTDNYGGEFSGRYRLGAQVTVSNVTGVGDKVYLGGLTTNHDMHNYQIGYERPMGLNTQLGMSYSRLDYNLGSSFREIDAVGIANTFNLYGKTAVIDNRHQYLSVIYGYTYRRLTDEMRAFDYLEKKRSHAANVGISGFYQTDNAQLNYELMYTYGHVRNQFQRSDSEGAFHKFNLDINHLYQFHPTVQLYSGVQAQLANKALDGSEQFYLGGPNGVRAYPQGEASGDTGYQATVELRYLVPQLPNLTIKSFIDWGAVKTKATAQWRHLAGWGIGAEYAQPNNWLVRVSYARKLDGEANRSSRTNHDGQLWFQVVKKF